MFRDPVSQKDGPERSTVYKKGGGGGGRGRDRDPLVPLTFKKIENKTKKSSDVPPIFEKKEVTPPLVLDCPLAPPPSAPHAKRGAYKRTGVHYTQS